MKTAYCYMHVQCFEDKVGNNVGQLQRQCEGPSCKCWPLVKCSIQSRRMCNVHQNHFESSLELLGGAKLVVEIKPLREHYWSFTKTSCAYEQRRVKGKNNLPVVWFLMQWIGNTKLHQWYNSNCVWPHKH